MKRTTLTLLFISFYLIAHSQKMKYVQNIYQLFSLHNQDLTSYKNDKITLLRDINGERLGINMQLLPASIIKKYFPEKVNIDLPVHKKKSFDAIIRLEQENENTIRLDFYSTWNESYNRDQQVPSTFEKRYQEFVKIFKNDEWEFKNSYNYASTGYLIFAKQDLELSIVFDLIGDVQEDPLYSSVNYSWPASHVTKLYRYAHFIFWKNLNHNK